MMEEISITHIIRKLRVLTAIAREGKSESNWKKIVRTESLKIYECERNKGEEEESSVSEAVVEDIKNDIFFKGA